MTSVLLLVSALPLGLRLESRRHGSDAAVWWLSGPARLATTVVAMVAWLYWCGTALEGSDAAIAKLLGWLVLAAEATSHQSDLQRHAGVDSVRDGRSAGRPRRTAAAARCTACGSPLVTDRVPSRRIRHATPTRPRSRP